MPDQKRADELATLFLNRQANRTKETIMGDFEKAVASARAAQAANREIEDATARVIASMYHDGQASITYAFTSTGTVTDPTDVYREAFPNYDALPAEEKLLADMFGTYLMACGARPPVAGWSRLWL